MSFRLKHRRSIGRELERLVRKELRAAIARLEEGPPDEASVHEARKSVKKVRAIVKLLRAPLGPRYAAENKRLRAVARRLSQLRDADASLETLDALFGDARTIALVLGCIQKRQRVLRAQALARGSRLFTETAHAFRAAVTSWWHPEGKR